MMSTDEGISSDGDWWPVIVIFTKKQVVSLTIL